MNVVHSLALQWLLRALACVMACTAAFGVPGRALAQPQDPGFTAPPGSAQATPSPVQSGSLPVDSDQLARDAVDVFRRTCLVSVGQPAALVDAALSTGLAPFLGGTEGEASLASFLGDAPGQVYALGMPADVLLAIGDDGQCTVWAQRAAGPQVKRAFVAAVESLRQGGATVRATRDRKVQRVGGWRHQLGYDVGQPARSFNADAVTLMTTQPGLQVMRAAVAVRGAATPAVVRDAPR
jgi:hypothetical protein